MNTSLLPRLIFTFMAVIALLTACSRKPAASETTSLQQRIDSLFNLAPDFSGVVLVAEKGKAVYHRAFGYRHYLSKSLNDTTSIFELASVSKQFTAMAIMLLKEEGKLQYDDLLDKYIPGLPYPGITIRHLLNHTSGLPDYQAMMDRYWDKTKVAGNDDNIAYLQKYQPAKNFEPGTRYEYSNTGYMLLASVVEKVTGEDFAGFCRSKIFLPLQMTQTDIRTLEEKKKLPTMAWGHLWVEERKQYVQADSFPAFNYTLWLGHRKGPGRISATTSDLLRWDVALHAEHLISKSALQEAFSPAILKDGSPSPYGFGWSLRTHPTLGTIVEHTGDNPGYKTKIVRYIDSQRLVVVLCNNAHRDMDTLLNNIELLLTH